MGFELKKNNKEGLISFGILGQVWYLIASIPDLCTLAYFENCNLFHLPAISVSIPLSLPLCYLMFPVFYNFLFFLQEVIFVLVTMTTSMDIGTVTLLDVKPVIVAGGSQTA